MNSDIEMKFPLNRQIVNGHVCTSEANSFLGDNVAKINLFTYGHLCQWMKGGGEFLVSFTL